MTHRSRKNYPVGELLTAGLWHLLFVAEQLVLRHPDFVSIRTLDTAALELGVP